MCSGVVAHWSIDVDRRPGAELNDKNREPKTLRLVRKDRQVLLFSNVQQVIENENGIYFTYIDEKPSYGWFSPDVYDSYTVQ